MNADDVIKKLGLEPLPVEGGWFKETYRSEKKADLTPERCLGTCIYYLLKETMLSDWHKVASDEIWLYHSGSPAIQILLFPDGSWEERIIGGDIEKGHLPQSLIPAGTWQAAVLLEKDSPGSWGLFGAVVFPGFEYEDFTHAEGKKLAEQYPSASERISQLGLIS